MSFKFTKVIYKDIFSYFKYERVLSLCQKSKRFQSIRKLLFAFRI